MRLPSHPGRPPIVSANARHPRPSDLREGRNPPATEVPGGAVGPRTPSRPPPPVNELTPSLPTLGYPKGSPELN